MASRRRKQVLDAYNRDFDRAFPQGAGGGELFVLDQCNAELAEFVGRVVRDTESGRISAAEFSLFNFTYNSVENAIKDRQLQLERAERQNGGAAVARAKAQRPAAAKREEQKPC